MLLLAQEHQETKKVFFWDCLVRGLRLAGGVCQKVRLENGSSKPHTAFLLPEVNKEKNSELSLLPNFCPAVLCASKTKGLDELDKLEFR